MSFTLRFTADFCWPRVTYLRRSHEQHPDAEGSGCLARLAGHIFQHGCGRDPETNTWLLKIGEYMLVSGAVLFQGVYANRQVSRGGLLVLVIVKILLPLLEIDILGRSLSLGSWQWQWSNSLYKLQHLLVFSMDLFQGVESELLTGSVRVLMSSIYWFRHFIGSHAHMENHSFLIIFVVFFSNKPSHLPHKM